jgi:hypothetical protein
MESAFFRTSEKPGGENVCHEIGLRRKTLSVKDEVWEQGEDKDGDDQNGDDDQGVEEGLFKFEVHVIQQDQHGLDQRHKEDQEDGGAFGEKKAGSDGDKDEADEPKPNEKIVWTVRIRSHRMPSCEIE